MDRDAVMNLIRQHFAPELQKAVTFTRWKDGIDIDIPVYAIEAFAEAAFEAGRKDCEMEMEAAGFRHQ